jgi:hypothetical protein
MYNYKASRAYHLREFCGDGNSEPNDTLKNVECGEVTTSRRPTRRSNATPVSKGDAKNKKNHDAGEGAASRRA